jgi:hypothetical protein
MTVLWDVSPCSLVLVRPHQTGLLGFSGVVGGGAFPEHKAFI